MENSNRVQKTIRVDADLMEQIKATADEDCRSVPQELRRLLELGLCWRNRFGDFPVHADEQKQEQRFEECSQAYRSRFYLVCEE